MPPKKKAQLPIQSAMIAEKHNSNSLVTLKNEDGAQFKLMESLAVKYSEVIRVAVEENKNDTVLVPNCSPEVLQWVVDFFNLHRQKQAQPIVFPLKTNQNLKFVMEEADAEYIDKIMEKGDAFLKDVLDIAHELQIQELKKRLFSGIAIKFMKNTLEQLKEEYNLDADSANFNQDELRSEMKAKIEMLRKSED